MAKRLTDDQEKEIKKLYLKDFNLTNLDIIGFLFIFPISRRFFLDKIFKKFKSKEPKKNNFIDGDFEDIEDDNDRKV